MIGAIAGDVVGSIYEWDRIKTKEFPLFGPGCFFTDDSVLTVALAEAILSGKDYAVTMRSYAARYPGAGYGAMFTEWAHDPSMGPYHSWGNGAAMRISPVGFAYGTLDEVLEKAKAFTEITHDHPEGVKGAQATAGAIFLARAGASKGEIRTFVRGVAGYDIAKSLDEMRPTYGFNESCQETVPQAIQAFLESTGFEDALRNAVSLGGDSDTLACITGGIAQAFYGGVPAPIAERALATLDDDLRRVTLEFDRLHCPR